MLDGKPLLEVDIANAVATFNYGGEDRDTEVGIACLTHIETGVIVWQSSIVVPTALDDAIDRIMTHLRTLRHHMELHWPEVAVYVNWWMAEPGQYEQWPHGLKA